MTAYHGSTATKRKYLKRVRTHQRADGLIQGTGWDGSRGRGCAVGCTLEAYDHARYSIELGIPVELAHLEDAIFEGLPHPEAQRWPERFLSAIRPGADLSLVWPRFAVWLDRELATWRTPASDAVVSLYQRVIAGETVAAEEWAAAGDAAWDAAWDAAKYAARAAKYAAQATAWAALDAAGNAAGAAEGAAYERQAAKLLSLLRAAPVPS